MNTRTRSLLIGAGVGAVLGVLGGLLYYNANVEVDEEGAENLDAPTPGDILKLVLSSLGVLRLIAE
jgi:hypothetical protein